MKRLLDTILIFALSLFCFSSFGSAGSPAPALTPIPSVEILVSPTSLPVAWQRGKTYLLATGIYPSISIKTPASGTQWIKIHRSPAPGQVILAPIIIAAPYVEISGTVSAAPSSYGIRVVNSTAGGKCIRLGDSRATKQPGNIVLQGLDLQQRGLDTDTPDDCLYAWAAGPGLGADDVAISHCYMHDTGRTMMLTMYESRWTIDNCLFSRNSSAPGRKSHPLKQHGEGWSDYGGTSITFQNNRMEDIEGTAFITLMKQKEFVITHNGWDIFGNSFVYSSANPTARMGVDNGVVASTDTPIGTTNHVSIHNNLFSGVVGLNSGIHFPNGIGNTVTDNTWQSCCKCYIDVPHDGNTFASTPQK